MEQMALHENYNSIKELLIDEINNLEENQWYKNNMRVIEMLQEKPCDEFSIWPMDHISKIEDNYGLYNTIILEGGEFVSMVDSNLNLYGYYCMDYRDKNCSGKIYVHGTGFISLAKDNESYDKAYGEFVGENHRRILTKEIEKMMNRDYKQLISEIDQFAYNKRMDFEKDMMGEK